MKYLKLIFNRLFVFGLMILVQVVYMLLMLNKFSHYSHVWSVICMILSILVVLFIVNKEDNPAYKIAWIIPILLFPIFGGLLYLFLGNKKPTRNMRRKLEKEHDRKSCIRVQDENVIKEIEQQDLRVAGQVKYLSKHVGFPIYENTSAVYYKSGEENFKDIIKELKAAKHYIFMEYFIIDEGEMWDTILDILEQKAKEGLDVRLIYDDMGCVSNLPYKYDRILESRGIKCMAFNPFIPFISLAMNNRDHRKIMVIDGHTGFTGGINLADEYINKKERFGYWKDTGIMLKGEGVWNLTTMFLYMWNSFRHTDDDYDKFRPHVHLNELVKHDGYIQPYGDSPLDEEVVGENVYLNLINNAKKYVYIFTPYLIIDNEMMTALCLASKRGIDVKIVTPGIPDKKTVFKLTRSYYHQLIENGVEIYEYTPGFLHAKVVVSDDEVATVGTINFDYRSLYLHFECGVFLYKSKCIQDIKEDALETIAKSRKIENTNVFASGKIDTLFRAVLRVFAPLL
ncbi:cardiolipin synthase [Intestinibacter sp.]|uniref:cardiolipin synthase n=1 Tax=Intestinibacter sp. TaxID=1965304 RepID=UPI002A90C173|nr:cardiolipin synthase [Intestinibacter sp.]MDY5212815.1 cardiolipin synthase [Intestinibacter sp.]